MNDLDIVDVLVGCESNLLEKFIGLSLFKGWILTPKRNGPIKKVTCESNDGTSTKNIIIVPLRGMSSTIQCLKSVPGVIFIEPVRSKEKYEDVEC